MASLGSKARRTAWVSVSTCSSSEATSSSASAAISLSPAASAARVRASVSWRSALRSVFTLSISGESSANSRDRRT